MRHRITHLTAGFLLLFTTLSAQEAPGVLELSLDEAKQYALEHNKTMKNAELDKVIAQKSIWEAISQGLPQVSASFDYANFFNYSIPFSFGGGGTPPDFDGSKLDDGDKEILKLMTPSGPTVINFKDQATAKLQVSQLVFSGQYLIAIQTAKIAREISDQAVEKTEVEIKKMVAGTYYLTLLTEQMRDILMENLANMEKTMKHTRAMVEVGIAEETDADQLSVAYSQLDNALKSVQRNVELSYNMLRFQLGVGAESDIKLKDNLMGFMEKANADALLSQQFEITSNIDYRLLSSQEKVSEKMVALEKSSYLPTLVAFYNYNAKIRTTDFDITPPHMIGVNLNWPLFTSFGRNAKVDKAKIELNKVQNQKEMLTDQLELQAKQLRFNLVSAMENYNTQKKSVEVAQRVYKSMENKYSQGMASSLELTQANDNLLKSQNNYVSAAIDVLNAKLELDKLYSNL